MQTPQHPKVPRIPEMVGATSDPVYLGKETTHISFTIHAPTGPALFRTDMMPRRVFLNIENITSDVRAPSYDVYLHLPPGDVAEKRPDLYLGSLAMFGLVETSRLGQNHPDNGLTYKLDITGVYVRLASSRDWDAKNLRVFFMPTPWDGAVNVRVGRVSLYFE